MTTDDLNKLRQEIYNLNWVGKPPADPVPAKYHIGIGEVCYALMRKGKRFTFNHNFTLRVLGATRWQATWELEHDCLDPDCQSEEILDCLYTSLLIEP